MTISWAGMDQYQKESSETDRRQVIDRKDCQ